MSTSTADLRTYDPGELSDDLALLDLLLDEDEPGQSRPPAFRELAKGPVPLSHAQRRLWFLQEFAPQNSAYNIFSAVRLSGPLDADAFRSAFSEIVRRHEALRTCFPSVDGRPVTTVQAAGILEIPIEDLSPEYEDARAGRMARLCDEEASRPFDLSTGPLVRVRLLRLEACEHVVLVTMHHIVADGWSMGILVEELTRLYEAARRRQPSPLPELALQYGDFALWQEHWLEGPVAAGQRRWWTERLAGLTPLQLPSDRPRPLEPSYQAGAHMFHVSAPSAAALKALGRREGATLYMTLLAAFTVLLHRYTSQDDVAVGSPVANRNRPEFEGLIGCFVNSLVMRCDVSGAPTFLTLLHRVRVFTMEAMVHQDLPFEEIVAATAPERDGTGNPLFQVMFSLENAPAGPLQLSGLALTPLDVESRAAKFDLLLNMYEATDGRLAGAFQFAADLFDPGTVTRMAGHFTTLLDAIVADPHQRVSLLPLLTSQERHQLEVEWNRPDTAFPNDKCIHELFEIEACARPDSIAVEFLDTRLSYAELNERANRLAHYLRELGVGPDQRVALLLERSLDMVVALVAVLKAGGAYVPLSTEDPDDRLGWLVRDLAPTVILTQRAFTHRLASCPYPVVRLDEDRPAIATHPADTPPRLTTPDHLAYVLYTSGSTGAPKGVCVSHWSVVRLVKNTNYARFSPTEVFLQLAPLAFDASTLEIWGPLLNGGKLAIAPPGRPSLSEIGGCIRRHGVTTLWLTAGLFHLMVDEALEELRPLRQLLVGGDVLSVPHVLKAYRALDGCQIINGYGPTENTTFTCCYPITDPDAIRTSVPIGRPIANTRAYILDEHLQPVPIGIAGELHVSGAGLARGYLGRSDLTAQRFIDNPFARDPDPRLYKTGDLCRYLPDGNIEFLGRRDHQVKVRGFRIELGEIETALVRCAGVRAAAVIARESRPGKRELVGYLVCEPELLLDALRQELAETLPAYMVPARYVVLPSLPLNENGKVDRNALASPADTVDDLDPGDTPRTSRERALASIWQDVLGRPGLGIRANYFESGGDSITAIQVVSRLRRFGWTLRVADLFRHPTIAALAPHLTQDRNQREDDDAVPAGGIPLTAVQRWFFHHYRGDLNHFNQAVLLEPGAPLDEQHLRHALDALRKRHDALRLRFTWADGTPSQHCVAAGTASLEVFDLSRESEPAAAMARHVDAIQKSLDIERGPMLKAGLFRFADGDRLLLAIHHLAVDAVSWRIVLEELELAYCQAAASQPVELGAKTCSFRRWAQATETFAASNALAAEAPYWSRVEHAAVTPLPTAPVAGPLLHGKAETVHRVVSPELTTVLLTTAHRAFRTEIMDLLLTALGRTLKHWSRGLSTRVNLEGHGREPFDESLDLSRTVGWFTSIYPFVLSVPGDDIGAQVLGVKAALREVPRKGMGYGILRYMRGGEGLHGGEAPQLSFNYLGQFDRGGGTGLFQTAEESSGQAISPLLPRVHELDMSGLVSDGRLILSLEFDPATLTRDTASSLLEEFERQIVEVAQFCLARLEHETSPSAEPGFALGHIATNAGVEDSYPLAPLQKGLLFESLFDPSERAYFCQIKFRFCGELDWEAFQQAWLLLCRRHAVLRSVFLHEGLSDPIQAVLKDRKPELVFDDLCHIDADERLAHIERFCIADRQRPFDLQRGPLLRVTVFRERQDAYHIVWSYHHVLIDGWCLAILQRDFIEYYAALRESRSPRLPPAAPYRNYIRWLDAQDGDAARRFWRDYLDGYDQLATLPTFARNDALPRSLGEETLVLDAEQSSRLVALAAQAGVTLSAVMSALWGLLLARYNDRDDVVFGSIASGRPAELPGVEEMVGLFICAVPVRVFARPDTPFLEVIRAVQEGALSALPHHHLPLTEIQTESVIGRNLFDHMLIFENYPLRAAGTPEGEAAEFVPVAAYDPTHYDLALTVVPGECIAVTFTFNRQLYRPDQIARTAHHLRTATDSVLRNPSQAVRDVSILPPAERDLLLTQFNDTKADYPLGKSFVDLFEEQAAQSPDAIALRCGDTELSYRDLNVAANRLAHYLGSLGVAPGVAVGLCVERTAEMIVGPLAILKAGGILVPLDPAYPPARLAFMVADAGIAVLLTREELAARLPGHSAIVVFLDADVAAIEAEPTSNPVRRHDADDLAYVVYTSGSTGQPKGVLVSHASISNIAFAWRKAYGLDTFAVRLLQVASMSFDVFIGDLVRALTNGGMLVVCPAEAQGDPGATYALLAAHRISIFEATPAVVLPLMERVRHEALAIDFLKVLIIGSDLLPARQFLQLKQWFGAHMRLINSYGVSEATIDSSYFETHTAEFADWSGHTPIGKPFSNTRFYVLDRLGNPQPWGMPGELHIGGDGVACGYLNRPELTASRFVTGSLNGVDRLYRTGDLARWLPDGNMEFLGRIDDQVKVRGYRIELGEIEGRLLQCDAVRQAAVVASGSADGADLVAYVVADVGWEVGRTREALKAFLPHYMIPSLFVRLDHLPLSPNGKVDRRALPDPRTASEQGAACLLPRNATEVALVEIWREVLQIDPIGVSHDFFELGGHSLKAMQITARIHRAFGIAVSLRQFFERPTISELAELIARSAKSDWSHIPPAPQQDHYPLSHAQRRLWIQDRMHGGAANNMPQASIIETDIDAEILDRAFRTLIQRHESLRTAFIVVDGEPRQRICSDVRFAVAVFDLRSASDPDRQVRDIADRDVGRPFDLTAPPLLRASLAHLPGNRSMVSLAMHHIVGDGWSGNVLYRELVTLYDAYRSGRPSPLKPLRIQYKDLAYWQAANSFQREESYWLTQLSGMPEGLALPYDFAPDDAGTAAGGRELLELEPEVTAGLRLLAVRGRTTLSNVILALFELVLFHQTRQEDLCVGMSVANRNHPDAESLIGFFVNVLPIRCRLTADMEFNDLLRLVSARTQEALEHQDYPFDLMIEKLNPVRQASRRPLINVVYSFQNFGDIHVSVEGERAQPVAAPKPEDAAAWTELDFSLQAVPFDLMLVVDEQPDALRLVMDFDSTLFLATTMREQLNTLAGFARMVAGLGDDEAPIPTAGPERAVPPETRREAS